MDFEITKREVLAGVVIFCVMFLVGLALSENIHAALMDRYQEYDTALQIDQNAELFEYGMRTDIGNAFVFGDLRAVDVVKTNEVPGEYAYLEKVKERYTAHTRTITTTDSKGRTHTRTETYYTWDVVGKTSWHCNKISFLGHEFDYGTIGLPSSRYIQTNRTALSTIRYKFYGCPAKYEGTLYAKLLDGTISNAVFYENSTIQETIDGLESGFQLIGFWVIWVTVMAGILFWFFKIENQWLED